MKGDLSEMVRKLVDAAISTCEPENGDEAATDYTRATLTRKFTEIIVRHRPPAPTVHDYSPDDPKGPVW